MGQGGFGAVYLAHDLTLNRPCALKENLETSDEVRRQFMREAQLLANLNHPNLPRVIDYFILAGQGQYLVMDYVEGEDLQDMLDRTAQPLPEAQALDWIGQVCDALTYLHQHNPPIIHRDIKPDNIRITPRGQAMLVDFGIAKIFDGQAQTTAGARAFTPGYSPPEQYGKAPTDERSDIYALGATLYTLLTNQTPPDSVDLLTGSAPPLLPVHLTNPNATLPVGMAITRAMEPERSRRFRSVADFKDALLAEAPLAKTQVIEQRLIQTGIQRSAQACSIASEAVEIFEEPALVRRLVFGLSRCCAGAGTDRQLRHMADERSWLHPCWLGLSTSLPHLCTGPGCCTGFYASDNQFASAQPDSPRPTTTGGYSGRPACSQDRLRLRSCR